MSGETYVDDDAGGRLVAPGGEAAEEASPPSPPSPPAAPKAAPARVVLEQSLAEAEARRDEYLADLQRLAADFDNYRKRALREQQAFAVRATERLVAKLLPVLDDLERALDAAERNDVPDRGEIGGRSGIENLGEEATVLAGVEMTKAALAAALAAEGLVEIEADGTFDPHLHEALMMQPSPGGEAGKIVQVVQKGYRLGDAVLRPARVIVAE